MNKRYFLYVILALSTLIGFHSGCSPSSSASGGNENGNGDTLATKFWLEPTGQTTIGVGQTINAYAPFKNSSADAYPTYLDPATVTWSSSAPTVASISSSGAINGLSEGTTTITAAYQTHTTQLVVNVSGTMSTTLISVTGQGTRKYMVYTPHFSNSGLHPALISMHGGGGSSMMQASTSGLNKFASDHDFYVIYPDGTGAIQTFNGGACCGSAQSNNINDVYFIRKILDDFQSKYDVDTSKIFATGFSNGSIMSHRLACELADRISGIAGHSGGSGQFDFNGASYYTCTPLRPIPILHIHATNDRNYPINGGTGTGLSNTPFYSIQNTINDWITRNNLTSASTVENVTSTTKCYHYDTVADSSKPSAPVRLCVIDPIDVYDATNEIVFGGGHSWAGGVKSPTANSDVPVTDFNANAYLWSFLNP